MIRMISTGARFRGQGLITQAYIYGLLQQQTLGIDPVMDIVIEQTRDIDQMLL